MSDSKNTLKGEGIVKPYLGFLDTNVLFKKPISCLAAIISLLMPFYILSLFIQAGVYKSQDAKIIFASILIVLIIAFAGIFGAMIWWSRRIIRDEGPLYYNNLRRFIQTVGEWLGTFVAISIFGCILVLMIFLSKEWYMLTDAIPFSVPGIDFVSALLYGPISGFLIIIATKILLFLLDPIIWLIKQIWKLFIRIVLYCYRCIISFFGTIEKNTPIWIGVTWLLAASVIVAAIVLCFKKGGLLPGIALAAALGFMGYLMFKRKHYDV